MRAMILAAGRGERMGELTRNTPKPLLRVAGHYLIEYAIFKLANAGIKEIIINVCYQKEQIKTALGDGRQYGVSIVYSEESNRLETGGGIFQALPLLGADPFLVVSCDIISDYAFQDLPTQLTGLAHWVMVENPRFHPAGDFGFQGNLIANNAIPTFTFANIGVYDPKLFSDCKPGHFTLKSVLMPAILNGDVTGELFQGQWYNVGTPEQLDEVCSSIPI